MHSELGTHTLEELRQQWADAWGITPNKSIGPAMLKKSLLHQRRQINGDGLTHEQQIWLNGLVQQYKKQPKRLNHHAKLKPGTRLVRYWKGKQYCVLVKADHFEYDGIRYKSLSKIATVITGTRWNGYLFFGLKKQGKQS